MGLFDDLATTKPESVQTQKPTKGRYIKEGYFDWENPSHAKADPNNKAKKEAVGVILPPYATYLQERVAAARAGTPFTTPFWLSVGNHVLGARNAKDKVYLHCQRNLIRDNKVNNAYPMLSKDVATAPDACPVCDSCWDVVWPKVKEVEGNKNSPEYKTYKEAHKQLCPQQKMVFNFLPAGSLEPVLLEASKTLGEFIQNLHYDPKQPDLLWPYPVGQFACCWLQIVREDRPDTTTYSVFPVYHNVPHVRNSGNAFDEALYLQVISKAKDLREVAKLYMPSPEETAKAITKRDNILMFHGIATAHATAAAVNAATDGVQVSVPALAQPAPVIPLPSFATGQNPVPAPSTTLPPVAAPAMAMPPIAVAPAAPPVAAPTMPAMAPATMAAPVAPAPAQPASANSAFDLLGSLLNETK